MADLQPGEPSAVIRERVIRARQIQEQRYAGLPGVHSNAQMNSKLLRQYAQPDERGLQLLKTAMNRLNLHLSVIIFGKRIIEKCSVLLIFIKTTRN